jgi:peptide/nickel transport system substrate-binding protein
MSDRTSSRRSFLAATGSVAGAAALAGCSGGGGTETEADETTSGGGSTETEPEETPTATEAETPSSGGTLNRIAGSITTFDPIAATDTESGRVIRNVFDTLMIYENATTTAVSQLATDFEVSEDFTTYTFTLAEDATFSNGDPVTASDVVYSWERLAQSNNSSRAYFILSSIGVTHETEETEDGSQYKPDTLGLEAVDEKTLKVELSAPFHATIQMMAYTSFAPVPEGIVGDIEGYDGEMGYDEFSKSNPIGAGPFTLEKYSSGTEVQISAREDHYRGGPELDGVHWQVIEKPQPTYNYAMNKNADLFGIPTSFYEPGKVSVERTDNAGRQRGTYGPLRNGETANYVGVPTINSFYIGFNMEEVPKAARQAFAHVANQALFIDEVFKGRGQASYHFTPPSIYPGGAKQYTSHAENEYPYGYGEAQQEKAIQVMEEAGYGPDNRVEVQFTQYQSDAWKQMAQILRDRLSSAYIDMKIEQAPFSSLLSRGRNGKLEAYTLGWIADWPAPDNFLQLLNPPQTDTSLSAPISYINWGTDASDADAAQQATEAYETVSNNQAPTEEDQQARNEAYVAIEEANWEDVGFLPVYHRIDEIFWYDTVQNFTPPGGMGLSRTQWDSAGVSR